MKKWLSSNWAYWLIVLLVTALGCVWLFHKGSTPVIRVATAIDENAPFWYMVSAFPFLGMLLGELVATIANEGIRHKAIDIIIAVTVLLLVSHFRLTLSLPISGHVFLLSYFMLRRNFIRNDVIPARRTEFVIALLVMHSLIYARLVMWTDPITLAAGSGAGAILFGFSKLLNQTAADKGDKA